MPYVKRGNTKYWKRSKAGRSRQTTKRRRPRPQVRYTGKPKTYKLSDKKINTLVEVRMQEIAKKEFAKSLKVLVSRKYLFNSYDPSTNIWTNLSGNPHLIGWDGQVVELSNIPKTDIQTQVNVPQADDPLTSLDENADGDGTNQLMLGQPIDGERWGDVIYIKGVSAQLRLRSFELTGSDLDLFQTIKIKYAFVMLRDEESIMDSVADKPTANECVRLDPWGYQPQLDKSLNMIFHGRKKKVLCQGETILNMNSTETSEKFHTIYKTFSSPIQLVYDENSQNGQRVNKKIYFVIRSTIPENSGYDGVKPAVYVCSKIRYYEP